MESTKLFAVLAGFALIAVTLQSAVSGIPPESAVNSTETGNETGNFTEQVNETGNSTFLDNETVMETTLATPTEPVNNTAFDNLTEVQEPNAENITATPDTVLETEDSHEFPLLSGPVTISGNVNYLDDNVTLDGTSYTSGNYTISGAVERPDNSTYGNQTNPDITDPIISWDWAENTTSGDDSINITASGDENLSSCVLDINGTSYPMQGYNDTYFYYEWTPNSGNSTLRACCNDTANNTGCTGEAWYKLDTSVTITLAKSANVLSALMGDEINWTITVNNTCLSTLNVTVNDTNGESVNNDSLGAGEIWTMSYATTAGCSSVTNTVDANASNGYESYATTALDSVTVTHCGNGVCDCSETCSSCSEDCGKCKEENWRGSIHWATYTGPTGGQQGNQTGGTGQGEPSITGPSSVQGGNEMTVVITDSDGNPAEGQATITKPDGTTMTATVTVGALNINFDQPGTWTIAYTDSNGKTVTKTITVMAAPEKPKPPVTQQIAPTPEKPKPQGDMTWAIVLVVIIAAAASFYSFVGRKKGK